MFTGNILPGDLVEIFRYAMASLRDGVLIIRDDRDRSPAYVTAPRRAGATGYGQQRLYAFAAVVL
jgi:hypothetical protein